MSRKLMFITATLIVSATNFLVNYVLSQKLDIEVYGQFSLVFATMNLVVPLVLFGQASSITSVFFSEEKSTNNNISTELIHSYWIMATAFFLVSAVVILGKVTGIVGSEYDNNFVGLFLFSLLGSTMLMFFMNIIIIFNRHLRYLLTALVNLIASVSIVYFNPSIEGYLWSIIVAGSVYFLSGFFIHLEFKHKQASPHPFSMKKMIYLGWFAIPGMAFASLNTYIDRYTLNYFLTLKEVAFYSLASTLGVGIGNAFVNALMQNQVVEALGLLQAKKNEEYFKFVGKNVFNLISLSLLGLIVYYFLGDFLVVKIFGQKYEASSGFIYPLFVVMIVNGIARVMSQPLVQAKRLDILLYISIVGVLINLILNIVFIHLLNVQGVILAMFISALSNWLIVFFCVRKLLLGFPLFKTGLIVISAIELVALFA